MNKYDMQSTLQLGFGRGAEAVGNAVRNLVT